LLPNTDIGGEASLGLLLRAKGWNIAGGRLGETCDAAGKVEELRCGEGADKRGKIRRKDVHTGLDVGC